MSSSNSGRQDTRGRGKPSPYANANANAKDNANKKESGGHRYGGQSVSKNPTSRRAPAPILLPSLRSQTGNNDPNVNLVPPGGAGWGNGQTGTDSNAPACVDSNLKPSRSQTQPWTSKSDPMAPTYFGGRDLVNGVEGSVSRPQKYKRKPTCVGTLTNPDLSQAQGGQSLLENSIPVKQNGPSQENRAVEGKQLVLRNELDEITKDDLVASGWALAHNDELDYSAKIVFSDEEDDEKKDKSSANRFSKDRLVVEESAIPIDTNSQLLPQQPQDAEDASFSMPDVSQPPPITLKEQEPHHVKSAESEGATAEELKAPMRLNPDPFNSNGTHGNDSATAAAAAAAAAASNATMLHENEPFLQEDSEKLLNDELEAKVQAKNQAVLRARLRKEEECRLRSQREQALYQFNTFHKAGEGKSSSNRDCEIDDALAQGDLAEPMEQSKKHLADLEARLNRRRQANNAQSLCSHVQILDEEYLDSDARPNAESEAVIDKKRNQNGNQEEYANDLTGDISQEKSNVLQQSNFFSFGFPATSTSNLDAAAKNPDRTVRKPQDAKFKSNSPLGCTDNDSAAFLLMMDSNATARQPDPIGTPAGSGSFLTRPLDASATAKTTNTNVSRADTQSIVSDDLFTSVKGNTSGANARDSIIKSPIGLPPQVSSNRSSQPACTAVAESHILHHSISHVTSIGSEVIRSSGSMKSIQQQPACTTNVAISEPNSAAILKTSSYPVAVSSTTASAKTSFGDSESIKYAQVASLWGNENLCSQGPLADDSLLASHYPRNKGETQCQSSTMQNANTQSPIAQYPMLNTASLLGPCPQVSKELLIESVSQGGAPGNSFYPYALGFASSYQYGHSGMEGAGFLQPGFPGSKLVSAENCHTAAYQAQNLQEPRPTALIHDSQAMKDQAASLNSSSMYSARQGLGMPQSIGGSRSQQAQSVYGNVMSSAFSQGIDTSSSSGLYNNNQLGHYIQQSKPVIGSSQFAMQPLMQGPLLGLRPNDICSPEKVADLKCNFGHAFEYQHATLPMSNSVDQVTLGMSSQVSAQSGMEFPSAWSFCPPARGNGNAGTAANANLGQGHQSAEINEQSSPHHLNRSCKGDVVHNSGLYSCDRGAAAGARSNSARMRRDNTQINSRNFRRLAHKNQAQQHQPQQGQAPK